MIYYINWLTNINFFFLMILWKLLKYASTLCYCKWSAAGFTHSSWRWWRPVKTWAESSDSLFILTSLKQTNKHICPAVRPITHWCVFCRTSPPWTHIPTKTLEQHNDFIFVFKLCSGERFSPETQVDDLSGTWTGTFSVFNSSRHKHRGGGSEQDHVSCSGPVGVFYHSDVTSSCSLLK